MFSMKLSWAAALDYTPEVILLYIVRKMLTLSHTGALSPVSSTYSRGVEGRELYKTLDLFASGGSEVFLEAERKALGRVAMKIGVSVTVLIICRCLYIVVERIQCSVAIATFCLQSISHPSLPSNSSVQPQNPFSEWSS
jgi:hypothetical protein